MRNDVTGAVKFVGAAVKFRHAWIIDIHVVSIHNQQPCYSCKDVTAGDALMGLCIIAQSS